MENQAKILIIDDEEEVGTLLSETLAHRRYKTFFSDDGMAGLGLAKRLKPDLIILDIMMPIIDGFTVQHQLKKDEETSGIPILFITGKAAVDSAMHAIASGAAGFIQKPFDVELLAQKVEAILAQR